MLQFSVDQQTCTRCGLCATDCPQSIIQQSGDDLPRIAPEQEDSCVRCQHCLAVCPTGAVSILGKSPKDIPSQRVKDLPSYEQMDLFVRCRRSIRQYKDQNVSPEVIRRLLATLAYSPTGRNESSLTFTVIDDKAVLAVLREKTMKRLSAFIQAGLLPERVDFLKGIAAPYFEQGKDFVFRGAPHALIVTAPLSVICPQEDVMIALSYFEFLARSGGLGTVWWGFLKILLETIPDLKPLYGIPSDHAYYAMLFGHPAVRYARLVQRDDAAKIRVLSV